MNRISYLQSLMDFNKRVLYQGTMQRGADYDLNDLSKLLFFNEVFFSNTNEMFEKYPIDTFVSQYIKYSDIAIKNIARIAVKMMDVDRRIKFSRKEDSFERRFLIQKNLTNRVTTKYFDDINSFNYQFENNQIYYLGLKKNGTITLSYIDNESVIYKEPMGFDVADTTVFWKTDECVLQYIRNTIDVIDAIAVKITLDRDNKSIIKKVEYYGNNKVYEAVKEVFGKECLMIQNPFLYLGDIKQIIDEFNDYRENQCQIVREMKSLNTLNEDILLEYPNDSFADYLNFLRSVIRNPETKEVFLTLYRIGHDPSIYYILKEGISKGIKIHVNIELFASGESINKLWMKELSELGVIVSTYKAGLLKVHAKITLVKFNKGNSIAQIGTGNYHTKTTAQYTDLSFITSNQNICKEVRKLFKLLEGKIDESKIVFSDLLLVTRFNARNKLIEMIDSQADEKGYICIKCNTLDDDEIIEHLELASKAGCKMDLVVRGVCTWIPKRLGENVKIKSVVWDKLEHSRVYMFGLHKPEVYIGSLDLVTNKIDKRIETLVRVDNVDLVMDIVDYLNRYISTPQGAWNMGKNGYYLKE